VITERGRRMSSSLADERREVKPQEGRPAGITTGSTIVRMINELRGMQGISRKEGDCLLLCPRGRSNVDVTGLQDNELTLTTLVIETEATIDREEDSMTKTITGVQDGGPGTEEVRG
jgi:hypothetical protein